MRSLLKGFVVFILAYAMSATAQTVVASSGTTATAGNVPYVSAATSTSTTLGTSPLSVSGSRIGIGTTTPNEKLDISDYMTASAPPT